MIISAARYGGPAAQSLQMESTSAGDCAVLQVAGEIDMYTAPQLRQRVSGLIDEGARHIIADLRGVDFLDSTGLGALAGSLKRLRMREGSLILVTSGDRILQIFRITGLTRAFAPHSSVLDAITADQHWQVTIAGQETAPANGAGRTGSCESRRHHRVPRPIGRAGPLTPFRTHRARNPQARSPPPATARRGWPRCLKTDQQARSI
jgi:anti-sigma B factor antagonist